MALLSIRLWETVFVVSALLTAAVLRLCPLPSGPPLHSSSCPSPAPLQSNVYVTHLLAPENGEIVIDHDRLAFLGVSSVVSGAARAFTGNIHGSLFTPLLPCLSAHCSLRITQQSLNAPILRHLKMLNVPMLPARQDVDTCSSS